MDTLEEIAAGRTLVRISEAAKITGLSKTGLQTKWDEGELEGKRIGKGRRRYFYTDSLYKFMGIEAPEPEKEADSTMIQMSRNAAERTARRMDNVIEANAKLETVIIAQINENKLIDMDQFTKRAKDSFRTIESEIKRVEQRVDKMNYLLIKILEQLEEDKDEEDKTKILYPGIIPATHKDAYAKFGGR